MNMKKTIAAVAASAMAVSAMAVTVSADTTLSYNLVASVENKQAATLTLQLTVSGEASKLTFTYPNVGVNTDTIDCKTITLRVTDENDASVNKTYTYSDDVKSLNYNPDFTDTGFKFNHELDNVQKPKIWVTLNAETKTYTKLETLNNDIKSKAVIITSDATDTPTVATNYTAASSKYDKLPFRTGPDDNVNIAWWLQNMNCRTDTDPYRNVLPTINDALANFDSATFVFTTATQPIAWRVKGDGEAFGPSKSSWGNEEISRDAKWNDIPTVKVNGYNTALLMAGGDASKVEAIYAEDWYGDKSYMSFTQHLYNGTDDFYGAGKGWLGYDGTDLGIAWAGQNLFGGALVINENLTMTLSDVDYFQWTNTTLSFDWEAIMDGAMTSNSYATYVQSIKLATSVDWYWDKMDVILVEGEGDDAAADAGTESDEETLDETDVDDTMDEELTEDETEEEETPADETEEAEETPVQDNPGTGNAPVALAVIPVALAAAAVVAKKRG